MQIDSEADLDACRKRYTELSNNINRSLFTLLSFGFFCALTLTQPDGMVITNGGKIKIPFVSLDVDFLTFLIIGPIALLGITLYLILFMEEKRKYDALPINDNQAYLFTLGCKPAKVCTGILFFGFTPLILLIFYLKTRVHPSYAAYAWTLMLLTTLAMALYFIYQNLKKGEIASTVAIVVLCGLLLIPITPFFNLNSRIPISVSGADLSNLNLIRFRLAGAQAEKTKFTESVFYQMDLTGLYAPHANFQGANFVGATLHRSDLGSADLQKANLSWSSLKGCILVNAFMQHAKLIETDLTEAVLESAHLENANFSGAVFRRAALARANFDEADLSGAVFEGAVLIGADLRKARNLTQGQLDTACGDNETLLGAGLNVKPCALRN